MATWVDFESRVRALAQNIWGRPCEPLRIGGVNIDGAVKLDAEIINLIEITEERTLGKVRGDIVKLQTAKAAAFASGILARCFCVVNGAVTDGMREAGKPAHIAVLSGEEFSRIFFDFSRYQAVRAGRPFGSAVNPITGEADPSKYIPVSYVTDGSGREVTANQISEYLRDKRNVILLGEYGTGKSRCVKEIFDSLSVNAEERFTFPIAIDLRRSWGLESADELIRRHFKWLGLDDLGANAVRATASGSIAYLLDGFDEIGAQAWSSDSLRLMQIRAKALEGVKSLVRDSPGGHLITGREHYFTSNKEMFSALGVDPTTAIVIRVKNEFSDTELLEYFTSRQIDVDVPGWLPRRPLICQTISDLSSTDFDRMFGEQGNEVAFWHHFMHILCERDAKIHVSFDAEAIFKVFVQLSRITRPKSSNVGPISLSELQQCFVQAVGSQPDEGASNMLQRLPSLGRINSESNDRQFVDVYILDGLRACDVVTMSTMQEEMLREANQQTWVNGLDDLGQRIAAEHPSFSQPALLRVAEASIANGNKILASDAVAVLMRGGKEIDFKGTVLDQGSFVCFTFEENIVRNLSLSSCYISEVYLPVRSAENVRVSDCVTSRVYGVANQQGLPSWIVKLDAESFDSVSSQSRIREIGLPVASEMLVTFVKKTFFQRGAGRKEEALLRGFGQVASRTTALRVLNLMLQHGLLTKFKGREGDVYSPERSYTARMQKMLNELASSSEPIWGDVARL